jgi:hypothetical protein
MSTSSATAARSTTPDASSWRWYSKISCLTPRFRRAHLLHYDADKRV